ncbi:MAG: hypothetical protein ACE5JB_08505 [bacterium]
MIKGFDKNLRAISFVIFVFLPMTAQSFEEYSNVDVKEINGSTHKVLEKSKYFKEINLPDKRLLLEKYFLLIQKQRLERIKNPSPQIQKFKRIIRRQLKIIERQLNRKVNDGIVQTIA